MNTTLTRTALWSTILLLIFVVGAPAAALAQGRGRGLEKKAGKFKNGHDARDGRWDGKGPRSTDDRYDTDDRNDDDYRYGRGSRTGNRGGTYDRTEIRRRAQSIGYQEGYRAGQEDRARGRSYDLESHNTYRDGTAGYDSSYGDIEFYRSSFRQAYRQGYQEGYGNRSTGSGRTGRAGRIIGDILGRP